MNKKHYGIECEVDVDALYKTGEIFPAKEEVFRALELCPIEKVKVVILGQDPYPTPGHAHGLAFSVKSGVPLPWSLKNIYKEANINKEDGNLENWAKQGVLLLNTILTVEKGKPLSHKNLGWEKYTKNIIEQINRLERPVIFMLWGGNAKKYGKIITNPLHKVLTAGHPSPLSANKGHWFGNGHFEMVKEIDWND